MASHHMICRTWQNVHKRGGGGGGGRSATSSGRSISRACRPSGFTSAARHCCDAMVRESQEHNLIGLLRRKPRLGRLRKVNTRRRRQHASESAQGKTKTVTMHVMYHPTQTSVACEASTLKRRYKRQSVLEESKVGRIPQEGKPQSQKEQENLTESYSVGGEKRGRGWERENRGTRRDRQRDCAQEVLWRR
eukprot:2111059-Pleurochrysis_carterae.AAC.1